MSMRQILLGFVVLLSFTSCTSKQKSVDREPAGVYWSTVNPNIQNYPLYWPDLLDVKPEWTINDLMNLIRDKKVKSVEELVPLLPLSYRQEYALVYESRSIQKSNPKNPRIIMFGRDAQLIMTFNGDKKLPGFEALEVMEFNKQRREFALFEIILDGKNVPLNLPEKNPGQCVACHHRDPKPIWSAYPKWPGVYQSHEATVLGGVWRDYLKVKGPDGQEGYRYNSEELDRIEKEASLYEDYLRGKDLHPRYKHLIVHSESRPSRALAEYLSQITLNEERGRFDRVTPRPNADLGSYLSEMNMLRVMRKIENHRGSRAYSYALLAATACSDGYYNSKAADDFQIQKFFPAKYKFKRSLGEVSGENFHQSSLSIYYDEEAERKWLGGENKEPLSNASGNSNSNFPSDTLKFVLENMGMDTSDFGLEFHQSFDFDDGFGSWSRFQRNLWRFALYPKEMNPDIYGDFSDKYDYGLNAILKEPRSTSVCKRLQQLSVSAIARGNR